MRVYKPTRSGPRGRAIPYRLWYVELRDHDGIPRRLAAFTDKTASEALGRDLERLAERRAAGLAPDRELSRIIEAWPAAVREKAVAWGLLGAERDAATRPLAELLGEWRETIGARERTADHVERSIRHARRLFATCGLVALSDIRDAVAIERALKLLREGDPATVARYVEGLGEDGRRTVERERTRLERDGLSIKASNHVAAAARAFTRWATERRYLAEDPLRGLRPLNARVDRRRVRRALSVDELRRVVQAAHDGAPWRGVPGPVRALTYVLGAEAGLRFSELRSLRVASLDLADPEQASLELPAADAKNRQDARLPLRAATARALAAHVVARSPLQRLFELPHGVGAAMLAHDLASAGIPYTDESGRVADFHALRGQAATHALAAGASPKVAQRLLRHSSADLTLGLYARVRPGEDRAAVEALPEILPASAARATGTDGEGLADAPNRVASSVAFHGASREHSGALDATQTPHNPHESASQAGRRVSRRGFEPLFSG